MGGTIVRFCATILLALVAWADSVTGKLEVPGASITPRDAVMTYDADIHSLRVRLSDRKLTPTERKYLSVRVNSIDQMFVEMRIPVEEINGRLQVKEDGKLTFLPSRKRRKAGAKFNFWALSPACIKLEGNLHSNVHLRTQGKADGVTWKFNLNGPLADPQQWARKIYPPVKIGTRHVGVDTSWEEDGEAVLWINARGATGTMGQGIGDPKVVKQLIHALEHQRDFSYRSFKLTHIDRKYFIVTGLGGGLRGSGRQEVQLDRKACQQVADNHKDAAKHLKMRGF